MIMTSLSPYELIDVQVVESNMTADIDLLGYPPSMERPLTIKQDYIPIEEDDEGCKLCELRLSVDHVVYHQKIKGSRKKTKPILELHVVLRGLVSAQFAEDVEKAQQDYLLRVNATSLLYAEVRAHLLMLTALSPVGKVILPPVDPYTVVDELMENDTQ